MDSNQLAVEPQSLTVTRATATSAGFLFSMAAPGLMSGAAGSYAIALANLGKMSSSGTLAITDTLPTRLTHEGAFGPRRRSIKRRVPRP